VAKTICPGQDTRFWKPEDVFEVQCGGCGYGVEFFKDDAHRRCPRCGQRVQNPKLNLGCAQWCEHAKECLGYDPKEKLAEIEAGQSALTDRLIIAMKAQFKDDQRRISHALAVLEQAEAIMAREGGQPKVILAAAILHDIGIKEAERKHGSSAPRFQELEGPPIAERILKEIGVDAETIDHVSRIVANHHSAKGIDSLEFRVVYDADWLVNLPQEHAGKTPGQLKKLINKVFKTATGRERAKALLTK